MRRNEKPSAAQLQAQGVAWHDGARFSLSKSKLHRGRTMQSAQIANGGSPVVSPPGPLSDALESMKDSRQRWWLLALLFTGMVFAYAQRGTLSVANKSVAQTLHLNPAEMGLLQSAFFWVYAFTQMPAGWIVDRFGVRRAYS